MLIFSKLYASGLLGLADTVIIPLDIRNVAQCDRNRISNFIRNTNTVQAGCKFTWIGSRNEKDRYRQRHKIFQGNIQHIKQLLLCHIISPEQMTDDMFCPIQSRTLIRVKQKNKQIVQKQKYQHKNHHKADFFKFDPAEFKCGNTHRKQPQKYPGIVGDHAGKGKQQEKSKLGCTGQLMHHTLPRQIIQYCFSSHGYAPPCLPL